MMRIDVHATPEDLAQAAADHLAELLAATPVTFGLAGGSTPAPTYQALSRRPLDWSRVTCWLPDERWVPPDDPASTALMARRHLIDHVPAQLIAPDTTLADPGESAAAYQRLLESEFDDGPDVGLLGIGDDGHTASLFPGSEALGYKNAGYVANWVDQFGFTSEVCHTSHSPARCSLEILPSSELLRSRCLIGIPCFTAVVSSPRY